MALYDSGMAIVYTNQVPYELDVLRTNLYNLTGVCALAATVLGIGVNYQTMVRGFPCVPASPPSLNVLVGSDETPDIVYMLAPLNATDYGVIPADTAPSHYQFKQGYNWGQKTLSTPAPVTPGNSVIHLIQTAFSTQDVNNVSRPYFNSTNPDDPIFNSNYDTRTDLAILQVKYGIEASSPTPPPPDAGFEALWYVTVVYGATSIVSGDIAKVSTVEGQPFITQSLTNKVGSSDLSGYVTIPQLQNATQISAIGGGTANAITATPSPAYTSLTTAEISVYIATTNTGPTTLAVSALGAIPVRKSSSSGLVALSGGEITQGWYKFKGNGTNWILSNPNVIASVVTSWDGATTPVDVTAGTMMDITDGEISFTGSSSFVTPSQLQNQTLTHATASGSPNTFAATISGYSPSATFQEFEVEFPTGNTDVATLNLNGGGAKEIIIPVPVYGLFKAPAQAIANGGSYKLTKYGNPDAFLLQAPSNNFAIYAETRLTTTQTVSGTGVVPVAFNSVFSDPFSIFSPSYAAYIALAGRYRATFCSSVDSSGGFGIFYIYVNGSFYHTLATVTNASTANSFSSPISLNLSVGDTVTIEAASHLAESIVLSQGIFQLEYLGAFGPIAA